MDALSRHLLTMAYHNGWANHRLYQACSRLGKEEFGAARVSFFPSIKATLNHILTVDWFYLDALEREMSERAPRLLHRQCFGRAEPFSDCAALRVEQKAADARLVAYCRQLDDGALDRPVTIARPDRVQCETRTRLLAHLFVHQIHHRGQVHAMLAGSSVAPPQLDEFFCAADAPLRAAELAELGWTEQEIWA